MNKPIFTATHIVKRFGPTIALNDVDISVYPGEIRGFIGENGSGKSTMSQIMTGIYFRNSGSMVFKEEPWEPKSMMDALSRGIGIAVQENGTISGCSVAENIFLCELEQFSGIHYFEIERIISFSKYFDIDLTATQKEVENALQQYKEKSPSKQEINAIIHKLQTFKLEALKEFKQKKSLYVSKENEDYNQALDKLTEEFNLQSKNVFEKIKSLDASEKFKEKKYKYELSLLKKNFKKQKDVLDLNHQLNLQAIEQDAKGIKNTAHNACNKVKGLLDRSGIIKVKHFFLKLIFGKVVNQAKLNRHAKQILANIGVYTIRPELPMGVYDIQSRKLVEIAKILAKNPEIFIVDETTTALSEDGRQILYKKMNDLKAQGKAVLFISHDLDEIMEKCDTLTVLRDGSIVANLTKEEFDANLIKKYMIGRELKGDYYRADFIPSKEDLVLLKASHVHLANRLTDINLDLHAGEIVGVGGLSDCGMHDLGKVLFGAFHPTEGAVYTGEQLDVLVKNEYIAMQNKIGYLPKDRDVEALALNDSIYNNIAIASINNIRKMKILVSKKEEREIVKKEVDFLQIKCNSSNDLVRTLSGGNKQKVSLGKWLGNDSKILILDCPTRGVDIGVKQFIYQLMIQLKREGYAILMISEELPELIGMSDRLLIMKNGRIEKEFLRSEDLKQEQIVDFML